MKDNSDHFTLTFCAFVFNCLLNGSSKQQRNKPKKRSSEWAFQGAPKCSEVVDVTIHDGRRMLVPPHRSNHASLPCEHARRRYAHQVCCHVTMAISYGNRFWFVCNGEAGSGTNQVTCDQQQFSHFCLRSVMVNISMRGYGLWIFLAG